MKRIFILSLITLFSSSIFAITNTDGIDPTKKAFKKWCNSFVLYPQESTIQNEEGLVIISFELSISGTIENIEIEKGVSEILDQKAIEMVKAMPKAHLYENGFIEGTRFSLPIKFEIQ